MRIKLLAVAIATGLTLPSFGAAAQSAAATPGGDDATLARLQAQISTLQAQVAELQSRPADPTASDTAANGGDSQARETSSTRIGGKMFFDLTRIDQTENGSSTDDSGTGFDVKRFYLSIDHRFDDVWAAHLTTDFNYSSSDGQTQVFVKKAYVEGKFSKLAKLRLGAASMPWVPLVEDWYGYRYVEKVLVDRTRFGTSTDWGLHLSGGKGVFDYQVSAVNGAGYRDPSRTGHIDFAARVGMQPVEGLIFAIGTYSGTLGDATETSPALHRARRYDAMLAWNRDGLRLGAEWFRADNWRNVATLASDSAAGRSLWGSYDFGRAAVFARHDRTEPSRDLDPALTDTYWHAGVAFALTKGIKLALAYKDQRLDNDADVDAHTREFGAWGEVKW